jgi:hypothetical protein
VSAAASRPQEVVIFPIDADWSQAEALWLRDTREESMSFGLDEDEESPSFWWDEDEESSCPQKGISLVAAGTQRLEVETIDPSTFDFSKPVLTPQPAAPANAAVYPLAMPEACMYGWLGDATRTLHAPPGPAYCTMLAMFAGQGINTQDPDPKVRGTIYVAITGDAGKGKSIIQSRAAKTFGLDTAPPEHNHIHRGLPASDRGIIMAFGGKVAPGEPLPDTIARVLALDEMQALMDKIAIQNSSLEQTLCEMWSRDGVCVADKQGLWAANVRMSLVGNLKAADPSEFQEHFGANTASGLYDRFIFAPNAPNWTYRWQWVPAVITPRAPWQTRLTPERFGDLDAWRDQREAAGLPVGRLAENALRVALISASANWESEVSPACMAAALRFAEWQGEVREVYCAGVARNDDAIITGVILDGVAEALKAHEEGKPKLVGKRPLVKEVTDWRDDSPLALVSFRLLTQSKNWSRKWSAPALNRVRKALQDEGTLFRDLLVSEGKTIDRHPGYYHLGE